MTASTTPNGSTVDQAEVARFSALAAEWWNPRGKMGVLHKFNPVRLGFIKEAACRRFGRDAKRLDCLAGLRILDIGCGGGMLCEPLARLGRRGGRAPIRPPPISRRRRLHATEAGLAIDYRETTAEALADAGERFDVVLAMEVVEHVADVTLFVRRCGEMVKPGGLMIAATLNRTLKSFTLAIVGAEYVLRLVAARHPPMGQVRHPERARDRARARRPAGDRGDRRDLQSARRPLADLDRHRRELHGHRREASRQPMSDLVLALGAVHHHRRRRARPCATPPSASSPRSSARSAPPMCASCSGFRSRWCFWPAC